MIDPHPPERPRDSAALALAARRQALALLPLRLFLGVTFLYGGIQKLSDPGYLHQGAPTYIGTQLHGFAHGTPGGFILRTFAIPHPVLAGVGVALAEIAIGLLVTSGLLTRPAAAAGLALNLLLFLTNSWSTYPYFLGSDIIFVFAWLPFVLVGADGQPSFEPALARLAARRRPRPPSARASSMSGVAGVSGDEVTRRTLIGTALTFVSGATGLIAGVSALARGSYSAPSTLGGSPPARASAPPPSTRRPGSRAVRSPAPTGARATALPAGAVRLGPSSQLPAGQGATYRDPHDGSPDLVIRQPSGQLVAHSAVCTHAGCTVSYQGGQIVCPCHGATYNAQTGAVEGGPAPDGLAPRRVIEHGGQIYAV